MRATIASVAFCFALAAQAQQLDSRRTHDLDLVYYDKAHEYLSYHLARAFENSLAFDKKLFHYTPSEPVVILMQDFGDYGHGGTSTVPWNYISIGIEPFDYVYDVMPTNERMNWLMHHELIHVVATDKAADSDLEFRKLFHGKVVPIKEQPLSMLYSYLASPRWYSPRWYHEGIAVFLETWMAGGVGRALGGYDEMVFRTMVLDDAYFYDVVGLESEGTTIDFQIGQNSYLYGTRFMSYLGMKFGPEKVVAWVDRSPGSKRYFASQFEKVFGTPLDDEWQRWITWEKEWQKANLARIRQYPVTPETPILRNAGGPPAVPPAAGRRPSRERRRRAGGETAGEAAGVTTLGSVSRSFYDPERKLLYAAINRPAHPAQIVAIDVESGKMTPLTDVVAPALYFVTSMAYDPKGRKIFYTTNNSRGWRDLNELDLTTGRRRLLLKNCRTGDLVVNPADQSIWGVQHHNGRSTLVVIPPPYNRWRPVMTLDYGRDIFDLDISPDGKMLTASAIEISGREQLIAVSLDEKHTTTTLHEFENNSPLNFVFSPDGRYLYGTTYFTGVSNVFRYDFQTKKMEAISNVETGLFRPIPISNDTMIAYDYTAKGFAPVRVPITVRDDISAIEYLGQQVVEKHPIVKEWNAGSPARVNLDEVTTYAGPYHPFARVKLGSFYPVVEGYKNTVAAGVRFNASDPLGLRMFDLTAAVSPGKERLHLKFGYDGVPWRVRLGYNATDFYDLFGPTKVSRKGQMASLSYHHYLLFERPRTFEYTLSTAYYGGLDTLPDYQNIRAPFREYQTAAGRLDYRDLRRTIGAVDDEYGSQWTATTSVNHVAGDFFPRFYGTYDRGFLLPMDHSSFWVRTAAGKSFGNRDNPFANFFFGAFGNNWIDYQEVRRYRDFYSFPGLELNAVGGTGFGRVTGEWTLPPIRFRRVGIPSLYANWARVALFSSALRTRETLYDVGAQIDFSLVMFSNLESTFSLGYATAMQKGRDSHEVMVSLKLLR